MADNTNPSVVKDESGDNYGGINMGSTMGEAQMQYLENLNLLAQKMPPKPLDQSGYFPNSNQGVVQGNISSKTLGSVPLIATGGGLLPFGIMDEMDRSKAEAEAQYYKSLKSEIDKPLFNQKVALMDPWKQPAFGQKIMGTADKYLEKYTQRFGGDAAKAYIATKNDKNFQKTIQMYADYANIFNSVYPDIMKVKDAQAHPETSYADPVAIKAADDFLSGFDDFEHTSPDTLKKNADNITLRLSAVKLAESVTTGLKDQVIESNPRKNGVMSNDEMNVFETKTKTNEGVADNLIKVTEADPKYAWVKSDLAYKNAFEESLRGRVHNETTLGITQVKSDNANTTLALKKMGVDVQPDGNINFTTTRTALIKGTGYNAVSFPNDSKPIPSFTGMDGYILYKGSLRHVKTDQSFPMTPKAEYDVSEPGILSNRYDEVNMNLQSTALYESEQYNVIKGIHIPIPGTDKGGKQTVEATLTDVNTGEEIKLMGDQTMLVSSDQLDKTIEANYPPMIYVHQKLEEQSGSSPYSRKNSFPGGSANPIDIPEGAGIDFIKNDPNVYYRNTKTGKITFGSALHEMYNKQNKK